MNHGVISGKVTHSYINVYINPYTEVETISMAYGSCMCLFLDYDCHVIGGYSTKLRRPGTLSCVCACVCAPLCVVCVFLSSLYRVGDFHSSRKVMKQ